MKQKFLIPKVIKIIKENKLEIFSSNAVSKLYNSKYKNSISSNQVGQLFCKNYQFQTINSLASVQTWRLAEGVD
tara:strand:- start:207 stop:428 length:222 start_codon:yes stop_codon:yes gene_type:complete